MAGWLESLPQVARLAYPAVVGGVRKGLSIQEIWKIASQAETPPAFADVKTMVYKVRELAQASSRLKYLPFDRPVNPDRLLPAPGKISRAFSFQVRVGFVYGTKGEQFSRFVTVSTNQVLTRRQIEAAAYKAIQQGKPSGEVDIESVQIDTGMRAGPAGLH